MKFSYEGAINFIAELNDNIYGNLGEEGQKPLPGLIISPFVLEAIGNSFRITFLNCEILDWNLRGEEYTLDEVKEIVLQESHEILNTIKLMELPK